ncbi:flagellar hook-associated family protein [Aureimonas sp. AU40]|uniref:flagellar hook-associated family protein n=1 Tax=Aureimonas sp. AU40 TaxID=1637747 RepID=UPI0007831B9E|nr:flagellar hook-associated family protein [Aureimonas sp. AU40]
MSISSLTLSNFSRTTIQRVQTQLADAQTEFNTGRHADVGRTLGYVTGNTITYRAQESSLQNMVDTNKLVASRFTLMDNALTSIRNNGDDYSKALINGTATGTGVGSLIQTATQGLQSVLGSANLSSGGQYLFSGTRSEVQPVLSDTTAITTLNGNLKTKFLTALGISDVSLAKSDDVKAYFSDAGLTQTVGGVSTTYKFSTDFDAEWATIANTGGDVSTAQISKSETIETSISASSAPFKNTVAAYAMIGALGIDQMGSDARQALTTAAQSKLTQGRDGIVKLQADIGVRQNRVAAANDLLTKQQDVVVAAYGRLENVDQTEAGLLINQLKTQLDATFAVTGKLQNLSILNYL